jgi:uncharacterized protein
MTEDKQVFEQMVPMRDGIRLHTFIYLPDPKVFSPPFPAIVQRSPYGIGTPGILPGPDIPEGLRKKLPVSAILRGWKAGIANGYAVVFQDTRGHFASEGIDRVYFDDAKDGYDTVEWVAAQSWCNGNVGMAGCSAGAINAYATAAQKPSHLKAIFAQVGSADLYNEIIYEGQALELERLLIWVSGHGPGLSSSHINALRLPTEKYQEAMKLRKVIYDDLYLYILNPTESKWWMHLPLLDFPGINEILPFWNEMLSHPTQDDFRDYHNFKSKIEIPAIHISTWYDIFLMSNLNAFQDIQSRVNNQKIFIGPGDHEAVYSPDSLPYDPFFPWFDYWLKGIDTGIMDKPPISYYHMGTGKWRYSGQWPPLGCEYKAYYLHSNGILSTDAPTPGEPSLSYIYDPKHPMPTIGGRCIQLPGGPFDQRPVEPPYRNDVLIYTSHSLAEDIEIAGNVKVAFHASSTCKDTDFTAKLIDVHPDARTMLVLEGVIRGMYRESPRHAVPMDPGSIYKFIVDLGDMSYVFRGGHRIQLDISSSNFPRRARNTNSGNILFAADKEEDIVIAKNTVYHENGHPSYIKLPIIPS